ncbi:MAG: type II toxin-antitoxin system VapC family toxin [Bacteroidota bacterium]
MAERYLIDTSAVIKYLNETFTPEGIAFIDGVVDKESLISFISEIELQVWSPKNPDDLVTYKQFISSSFVFGISDQIIQETIRIRKEHNVKLPDALIAATALLNNLTLIADNDKDFLKITALRYINPHSIA